MEERKIDRIIESTLIVIVLFIGGFFMFKDKQLIDESEKNLYCPYRFNVEVYTKDALPITFKGDLVYNYDSVPFEQVKVAEIIVNTVLRMEVQKYTVSEIMEHHSIDISNTVNDVIKENGISCVWRCNTIFSNSRTTYDKIEKHTRIGINNDNLVSSNELRYGKCVRSNNSTADRMLRMPMFTFPWFVVFGK